MGARGGGWKRRRGTGEDEESRGSQKNRKMNTRKKGESLRKMKTVVQQGAEAYILVGDHAISTPKG